MSIVPTPSHKPTAKTSSMMITVFSTATRAGALTDSRRSRYSEPPEGADDGALGALPIGAELAPCVVCQDRALWPRLEPFDKPPSSVEEINTTLQ